MPDDDNDDDYIKGRQTGSILFFSFLHFISRGLSVFLSHCPHPGAESSVYQIISRSRPRNSHLISLTGPFAQASKCLPGLLEPENGMRKF